MAGQPVVVSNQRLRTASELTQERRLLASADFPVNGQGVGTMRGDLLLTETALNPKQPSSFQKNTGRPKNASDFTAFVGSYALQNDNVFVPAGKTTNPAACTINAAAKIAEPTAYITGTTKQAAANTVPRSASDYIRERIACQEQNGQPHTASEVSMEPVFKDDTIRYPYLNKQYLSGAKSCAPNVSYPPVVNQVNVAITPRPGPIARPAKSKIPNYDQQFVSQDRTPPVMGTNTLPNCYSGKNVVGKYNTGGIRPQDALRYVEKHHGNDLSTMVNGRKPVPGEYQIPRGTPAHLKINDPIGPRVPGM